ncbi:hypothetical protein EGW08_001339 [Elysia chlorotica]|uniref:FAM234A/B beta-propeller domain-containing protein n=1 Tax=Elysia chlorotica TaxID=188477 RepID=A0A3S1BL72_ELYCH|nr:hypothetical protein EGW08_001339 [Elysia chlorotica]
MVRMSSKVRYHRLSQSVSDEDDADDDGADEEEDEDEGFEENILFDSRLTNTQVMERGEVFELERLGQPRVIGGSRTRSETRKRRICLVVLIVLGVSLIALAAVLFPLLNHAFNHGAVHHIDNASRSSENWVRSFNDTWSESSVRMLDIDMDGLDDIVVALARQVHVRAALQGKDMREHCKHLGTVYPCGGQLVALGGLDGAELWRCQTRSTILYSACADLDVNDDDLTDCVVSGRHATLQAVDVMSGETLWSVDPDQAPWSTHFVPTWTVHQAASLPDLDGDGVLDLVVSHGHDEAVQKDLPAAGRLILISGKSGRPIGNSFLEIPGGMGVSMSPVKYVTDSGAVYILFGSGSKTQSGTLMSISLPDLFKRSTGKSLENYNKDLYKWINSQQLDSNGVAFLTSSSTKGFVSPPILVDADSDGSLDILVTEFGGRVTLLDGPTLFTKWSRSFDGCEIHGSPTPGHYNTDLYMDYLIHLSVGAWDSYNLSRTLILNGADGSTLWSVEGSSSVHVSDLSLRTTSADNLSAFLVKFVGVNTSLDELTTYPGLDIMSRYFSDHQAGVETFPANLTAEEFQRKCDLIESRALSDQASCDQNLDFLKLDVLLFDHLTSAQPVRVMEVEAKRKYYLLDHNRGDLHCHALTGRSRSKIGMCAILAPVLSTGDLIESRALSDQASCDQNLDFLKLDVLLFDHLTSAQPVRVMEVEAKRKYYLLDHKRGDLHCHALTGRSRSKIGMCAVLAPVLSTGAVGDVDGDGSLDYVHVTQMAGPKRGDTGQLLDVFSSVTVSKLSLGASLSDPSLVSLSPTYGEAEPEYRRTHRKGYSHSGGTDTHAGTSVESLGDSVLRHFEKLQFLPAALQPWAQALGSRGGGWYDEPPS